MTADDIKALVHRMKQRLTDHSKSRENGAFARAAMMDANDLLTALLSQVETLTLENQRLRVDATWAKEKLANGLDS